MKTLNHYKIPCHKFSGIMNATSYLNCYTIYSDLLLDNQYNSDQLRKFVFGLSRRFAVDSTLDKHTTRCPGINYNTISARIVGLSERNLQDIVEWWLKHVPSFDWKLLIPSTNYRIKRMLLFDDILSQWYLPIDYTFGNTVCVYIKDDDIDYATTFLQLLRTLNISRYPRLKHKDDDSVMHIGRVIASRYVRRIKEDAARIRMVLRSSDRNKSNFSIKHTALVFVRPVRNHYEIINNLYDIEAKEVVYPCIMGNVLSNNILFCGIIRLSDDAIGLCKGYHLGLNAWCTKRQALSVYRIVDRKDNEYVFNKFRRFFVKLMKNTK